jgi:SulP family sulfate permease
MPAWLLPWRSDYRPLYWGADALAGLLVSLVLIPQSLAYALVAGVSPSMGLMAAMVGQLGYALLGRSPALSVGPVAIASAMTLEALTPLAVPGSVLWHSLAGMLACLSGLILLLMGVMRLGFLAHLLSHSVIGGFISGAALWIVLGQFKNLLNLAISGHNAYEIMQSLWAQSGAVQPIALAWGVASLCLFAGARWGAPAILRRIGFKPHWADGAARLFPLLILALAAAVLHYGTLGDAIPSFQSRVSALGPEGGVLSLVNTGPTIFTLLPSAALLAMMGFIESFAMAKAIAQKYSVQVDANAELRGLGCANLLSGLSGGMPVTGGLSRSMVNLQAGARTPMAGVFASVMLLLLWMGPRSVISALPLATLAAMIMVSVVPLMDFRSFIQAWRYDKADGMGWLLTFMGVLFGGVEAGVMLGVVVALATVLMRQGRPHIAEIGCVPGTEHFRNVLYHPVRTLDHALFIRMDANLFFGNWDWIQANLERRIQARIHPTEHLVLSLSSVSDIDHSAYLGLVGWAHALQQKGITLHLTEIKNPLLHKLLGHDVSAQQSLSWAQVHLSTYQAFQSLTHPGLS